MSTETQRIVTGVDFVSVPTRDLERAVAFYGDTLGLQRSVYVPERNFAEFETGTVTLNVLNPERMGVGSFQANTNPLALHVEDVAATRATLEATPSPLRPTRRGVRRVRRDRQRAASRSPARCAGRSSPACGRCTRRRAGLAP
jgi:catechol 2,3-dioxygenase-like lactoylglutathione lyase family enzyme